MPCNIINPTESVNESSSSSMRKQHVSFPESEEELVVVRQISMAEELLWMDAAEFQAVREHASLVSTLNLDKGFSMLLEPIANPHEAQVKLDLWAKMENEKNMRGLERYVCSEHRNYRDNLCREAVQAVLAAQQQARENGQSVELFDLLAPIYGKYSTSCLQFAQMIAKADEKAVHQRSRCRSSGPPTMVPRPRARIHRSVTE